MANPEHLEILRKGVATWKQWRQENPKIIPDLVEIDLHGADLHGADLRESKLIRADLRGANLWDANLSGAYLMGTDLMGANLKGADLSGANLCDANLSAAHLGAANLTDAILSEANFTDAKMGLTILAENDLSQTKGLDKVRHICHSSIAILTFFMSDGKIPEAFLRGCGVPEIFIQYAGAMTATPIEFYSCFISYSHADKAFARRLHDALQGRGIRCWLDEKQILPGDLIHRAVDEGIRLWDKVLLCCSENSLTSWWVDKEMQKALMKEEKLWKERGKEVLAIIPLSLDGKLFDPQWQDWKQQHLTTRMAANFIGWEKDNQIFEAQFELVVKALRADASAREKPPEPRL